MASAVQTSARLQAEAFTRAAEEATNGADAVAAVAMYAADARFQAISNGLIEVHRGQEEILRAWQVYMHFGRELGLQIRKQMIATSDEVIVIEWQGRLRNGTRVAGNELCWLRDGLMYEHHLYSNIGIRPASSLSGRLRTLRSDPRFALRLLAAQRSLAR